MRRVLWPALRHFLPLCVAAATFLGCGGPARERQPFTGRPPDLVLEVTFGNIRPKSFDPRSPDPRVRAAYGQLRELVGHDVEFHFDEALVPKWLVDFDTLFAQCLESVVADLAALRRESPELFAEAAPALKRLVVEYSATLGRAWRSFVDRVGVVHIVLSPEAYRLIPARSVTHALRTASVERLVERYRGKEPRDVPESELEAYIAYLEDHAFDDPPPEPVRDRRLWVTPRMAELASRLHETSASSARAGVRAWMVAMIDTFVWLESTQREAARSVAADSSYRRAQKAWASFFAAEEASFEAGQRQKIARAVFGQRDVPPERIVPGVDWTGWGLELLDRWARAGHPVGRGDAGEEDPERGLFDAVVCPPKRTAEGLDQPSSCLAFWDQAFARSADMQRIVNFVASRRDPRVTELVVMNTKHRSNNGRRARSDDAPVTLGVWKGLSVEDGQWRVASRTIGEELAALGAPLFDYVVLEWRRSPRRRGALLPVLGSMAKADPYLVDWNELGRLLEAPAGPAEFAALLDTGPHGLALAPPIWAAFGSGWSKGEIVAERLAPYLGDTSSRGRDSTLGPTQEAVRAEVAAGLVEVAKKLCADRGGTADLARLHEAIARRIRNQPLEERFLHAALVATERGGCP